MANVKVPLTVKEVEQLRATGVHSVGGFPGLCLQVTPSGGRSWILRYTIGGQRKKIGLGSFPSVGVRESREKAQSISNQIRSGIDPAKEKPSTSISPAPESILASTPQQATSQTMSFSACARQYIIAHRAGWANVKHSQQWENTLARYAEPVIGALPPSDITVDHLLEILTPIWSTKTETARRLRSRIELVLNYARALRLRSGDNPALWRGNLDSLLPNPRKVAPVKHHEAVDVEAARAVFQSICAMDSVGARCLEFTILTACRSGESRGALWTEIDLERALWTIPAQRMKMKRDHRIPLSGAAIDLLRTTPKFDNTDLVFSSPQKVHLARPLSDMTLTACHRRLKLTATVHGWRSTFKDWAAEKTSYANELSEMALAHAVSSGVESAYRRGDLFERRRAMMDEWAAFLTGTASQPA
jgi:integrase